MQGIEDALKAVQGDTIQELFSFLEKRWEKESTSSDPLEQMKGMRAIAEVGLAIYDYARSKEICQESKN